MQSAAHTGDIGKSFVDGIFFHIGREAAHDGKHPPGKETIRFVIRRQNNQPRADFTRFVQWNAALDSDVFGGVAGAGDNAAFTTGNERLTPKLGMNRFLTGCKKSVAVDVNNRARPRGKTENLLRHKTFEECKAQIEKLEKASTTYGL